MFKKILASIGIGAATVDTRLHNDVVLPGDTLSGEVHIRGGDVEQQIDGISLYLITRYQRETDDTTYYQNYKLVQHRLAERLTIQPGQEHTVPFSLTLPYETPVTMGHNTPVYVKTGLDIPTALDPKDTDHIQVRPHPLMQRVLDATTNLGFRLRKVDCEYSKLRISPHPFVQEFEFAPVGAYRNRLKELELIFRLRGDVLDVYLELDKRARGWAGLMGAAFDMNERYTHISVTANETDEQVVRKRIADAINRQVR